MNFRIAQIILLAALLSFSMATIDIEGTHLSFSAQLPNIEQNLDASKVKPAPSPKPKPKPSGGGGSSSSKSTSALGGFLGFIVGPILFFSAFPCIFYNQRRAAIQTRRINLAKSICEELDPTNQVQALTKNGKLVYSKGQTKTSAYISDPLSGIGGYNLIKIARKVEVLQWRQKTKKDGDREETYYQMQWVTQNSTTEGERYNNPQNWFIENEVIYNQHVYMGGYNINQQIIDLCEKTVPFVPNIEAIEAIKLNCNKPDRNGNISGNYIYFTPTEGNVYTPPSFDNYEVVNNKQNNSGQTVGSLRIKFELCPTGPMSLLAKSTVDPNSGAFSSYNIAQHEGTQQEVSELPQGSICCMFCNVYKQFLIPFEEILVVEEKKCSQQQLFAQLVEHSKQFTLIFRILAYVSMVVGICLFFSPITTILGYIPLVGGFVSGIAAFAIFIGAVIICIPLFAVALSLAWLIYNPKIGLIILSAALLIFGYIWLNGNPQIPSPAPMT